MSGPITASQIRRLVDDNGLLERYDERGYAPASYEMRVGNYFEPARRAAVDLGEGEGVAVAPGGFVLVGTLERVCLPRDMLGMMYLRSTYARRGFSDWFQGLVDPGYRGTLTVALHNLTEALVPIVGGERICHLVFYRLDEEAAGYEGRYQDSEHATPARYGQNEPAPLPVVGNPPGQGFSDQYLRRPSR